MLRSASSLHLRIFIAAVFSATVMTHGVFAQSETARPRFALLVGIKTYKSKEIPPTPGADADARLMKDVLVTGFGFPDDAAHIRVLDTEQATRERILVEFRNFLIKNARENSSKRPIIVFQFSGHGTRYPNQPDDVDDSDASDGWDEAIVPYDSRDPGVYDILDDELDDLSAELSEAAPNADILFIFDSCHSGTVTRDDSSARETTGDPRNSSRPPYKRKFRPSDVERMTSRNIVTLAAALPHEKAYPKSDLENGVMTFNLAAAMRRATKTTTYAELMRDVRAAVQSSGGSSQTPFSEGDENKPVLGESSVRSDPSFAVVAGPDAGGRIKINAGAVHGVRPGALIALYGESAVKLKGPDGFISYASIEAVGDRESTAVLPSKEANPKIASVDLRSKVLLASPTFGGEAVTLVLDDGSIAGASAEKIRSGVRSLLESSDNPLKEGGMLEVSSMKAIRALPLRRRPSNVFILKGGKFGKVFPDTSVLKFPGVCSSDGAFFPDPETEIFYFQSGISALSLKPAPVFGRYFVATDPNAVREITESLTVFARQQMMLNLENATSTLNDRIKVDTALLPAFESATCPKAGDAASSTYWKCKAIASSKPRPPNSFPQGQLFQVSIKNVSSGPFAAEALYVAVFLISTDGTMTLLNKGNLRDRLTAVKSLEIPLAAAQPAGGETLKIIVTRNVADLEDLKLMEQGDWQKTRSAFEFPLAKLLTRSGTRSGGDTGLSPTNPDSWGVKTLQWTILSEKFQCEKGGPFEP